MSSPEVVQPSATENRLKNLGRHEDARVTVALGGGAVLTAITMVIVNPGSLRRHNV